VDEELERALRRLGGAARTGELRDRGVPRSRIEAAQRSGLLVRHGRGCVAVPGVDPAFVAAARVRGGVTCVTALHVWDLPLLRAPTCGHVAIELDRGAPRPGLVPASTVLHWTPSLGGDLPARLVPVEVALGHAVRCLPLAEAVAVFDAALRRRLVRTEALRAARPGVGGPRFDDVMALVDPAAESIQESIGRVALVRAGLDVRTQVVIAGVGRVDLLVEGRVVVELDGFSYHSDRAAFREDRRRDRALARRGLHVLRFAFEDAVYATSTMVSDVQALICARSAGGRLTDPTPSVRKIAR
jgi:very-short-patch-repair endonuclease